jgi:tagatose 1,6-diphosphate aldolase
MKMVSTDHVIYLDPGELVDGDLALALEATLAADPARGHHLPAYRFAMRRAGSKTKVGEIGLKIGEPPQHLGHIWYRVFPAYRGHRFAARACRLVVPLARRHGLDPLRITCREDNLASRRTAALAGAEFVGVVETPPGYSDWRGPVRTKCVYHLRTA